LFNKLVHHIFQQFFGRFEAVKRDFYSFEENIGLTFGFAQREGEKNLLNFLEVKIAV
jgi:hypothetical protein